MFEAIGVELVLILILILLNGFFAGSEIAVVSSRRSALHRMAKDGKHAASIVSKWLKEPEDFLATVQIGVTVVGVLAATVGGATAIQFLKPELEKLVWIGLWAEPIAIMLFALAITYLSLVLGELVPKSLALTHREGMALFIARPILLLSKIATPFVHILTGSTRLILRLLRQKEIPKEMFVSEEEIRFLISEGASQGIFDQTEQQMIPKVFDFAEVKVKDLMIPKEKISGINIAMNTDHLMDAVAGEAYTRLPVYKESLDHIVGILHMKDLIYAFTLGKIIILQDLIRPALFVSESALAKDLLKLFQKRHLHMAVVQDDHEKTKGIVTLEDILERIVGDIQDEHDSVP
ncbi:MAG: HlyC/CorC family transporter [Elusimicrobia bacterium]|nr:HlyC/CorC family transporter [Elusimicrobiota bacterium]